MPIKRDYSAVLLLCGVVLAVFGNTLFNGFVWDDKELFLIDPVILEFRLKEMFFSLAGGFEYTPLVSLFLAIEYTLWGNNPFGYHLVKLALYLVTALLVYRLTPKLLRIVFKNSKPPEEVQRISLAAALMFAVHPLHTEVAGWISAINILLSGIMFLLSCSYYVDWLPGERKLFDRSYNAALLFLFVAASMKATVIILPLLLLLFLVYCDGKRTLSNCLHLIPFFLISMLFFLIHKTVATYGGRIYQNDESFGASYFLSKITVASQIPFFYINKFFLPFGLSAEYSDDFYSPLSSFPVIASIVGICAIASFAFATRKKHPEILFGLGWLLATMLPVLHFFTTIPIVADRYFYLPLFGLVFIIAVITGKNSRITLVVCGSLCIFWASMAIMQNSKWRSNETLWGHALKSSGAEMAYIQLADEFTEQGKYEKALDVVSGIKDVRRRTDIYSFYLGLALGKRGDFAGALSVLESSYEENKRSPLFLFALAEAYEKTGKIELAVKSYNETILKSKGYRAYTVGKASRAAVDRLSKSSSSQIDILRNDVAVHPTDNKKRNKLAMQLDHLGFYEEALTQYLELERRGEKNWQLFFNIGNVYKKFRKYGDALIYYDKSLLLNPDYIDTINNIGNVYEYLKNYDRAIYYYNLAISKEPKFAFAPFNLAVLYFKMGDKTKSLSIFNYTIQHFPHLREKVEPYLKKLQ